MVSRQLNFARLSRNTLLGKPAVIKTVTENVSAQDERFCFKYEAKL
jgi:hypothetical protein